MFETERQLFKNFAYHGNVFLSDKIKDLKHLGKRPLVRWDAGQKLNPEQFPHGMYFTEGSSSAAISRITQYEIAYEGRPNAFKILTKSNKVKTLNVDIYKSFVLTTKPQEMFGMKMPPNKIFGIKLWTKSTKEFGQWSEAEIGAHNAGNLALKKLMGKEAFYKFASQDEEVLFSHIKTNYPHLDHKLLDDKAIGGQLRKGFALNIIGAQEAKKAGYEAIRYSHAKEYLALSSRAISESSLKSPTSSKLVGLVSKLAKGARKMTSL